MSALGQKQTLGKTRLMSALPQKQTFVAATGMSALCHKRTLGHYSITSSAAVISDCGITSPSAVAVLRVITSSYLVGVWTGRSTGFSSLENAFYVTGNATILLQDIGAIGDQAASQVHSFCDKPK
jgi:hypothetical protein